MSLRKRTVVDDEGSLRHVLEYDDEPVDYDTVVVRHSPDDPEKLAVVGYEGDEITFQNAYETRDLQFDPISQLGRGEAERLLGVSDTDTGEEHSLTDDTPPSIAAAFNAIGMAVVPRGRWWLDGD